MRYPEQESRTEILENRINEFIDKLTLDNQNGVALRRTYNKISKVLTSNEKVEYIALQKKLFFNIFPDAIVLTNRRIIIMHFGVFGTVDLWDVIWRELADAKLYLGIFRAKIHLNTSKGNKEIDWLLKEPASKAYGILQEQEERTAEERRQRSIEETRAAAGGVVINSSPVGQTEAGATNQNSVAALKQLKEMLDAGLITQGEFEAKRQAILSRF